MKEQQDNNKASFLERHPKINTAIGLCLLIIMGVGSFYALKTLWRILIIGIEKLTEMTSHLEAVVVVALITGTVSIIGVIISSVVGKIIEYKKSRQDYLAKKREKSYEAFIEMFYKINDSSQNNVEYTIEEMTKDMKAFSQELTLWGSKKVVKKWVSYKTGITKYTNPQDNLAALEVIMNEMRKDMGTGKVKKWELMKLFINDLD